MLLSLVRSLFAFRQTCQRGKQREYAGKRRGGGDGDPVDVAEHGGGPDGRHGGLCHRLHGAYAGCLQPAEELFFLHLHYLSFLDS